MKTKFFQNASAGGKPVLHQAVLLNRIKEYVFLGWVLNMVNDLKLERPREQKSARDPCSSIKCVAREEHETAIAKQRAKLMLYFLCAERGFYDGKSWDSEASIIVPQFLFLCVRKLARHGVKSMDAGRNAKSLALFGATIRCPGSVADRAMYDRTRDMILNSGEEDRQTAEHLVIRNDGR